MREEFLNEIKNKEKNINEQIFRDYFLYQIPSYLTNILYDNDEIKHYKITKNFNNRLIKLRNSINTKKNNENENPKKQSILLKKSSTLIKNKKVKDSKYELLNKCFKDYQ